MAFEPILGRVERYYTEKLLLHGPQAGGVDWNSTASQWRRFRELLRLRDGAEEFTLNDYGCGYGALVDYLDDHSPARQYCGYDVSGEMIRCARQEHPGRADCFFTTDESLMPVAAYSVASGIFNVKLDTAESEWIQYVHATLARLAALSSRGFAFNMLTSHCDADRRQSRLFYADPTRVFDHCRTHFSRHVALLHDYPLYEFTIVVRLIEGG